MAVTKKVAVKKTAVKASKKAEVGVAPELKVTVPEETTYVVIDHPANGDVLIPSHYAVRIGASWGGIVEFQVDDAEWIPCRHNAGYWWFDWHNIPLGKHKLAARMVDNNGKVLKKSAVRRIEVK
jgi:hypothetical protein